MINPDLYRASDSSDLPPDTASFARHREDAERYMDNPGYGGSRLFRLKVQPEPGTVLDLVGSDDPMGELLEAVEVPDPGAISVAEWIPSSVQCMDALLKKGIVWVRIEEPCPGDPNESMETWICLDPYSFEDLIEEV